MSKPSKAVLKLVEKIRKGEPHQASHQTYEQAVKLGLIVYEEIKGPGHFQGFAGPIRQAGWRLCQS